MGSLQLKQEQISREEGLTWNDSGKANSKHGTSRHLRHTAQIPVFTCNTCYAQYIIDEQVMQQFMSAVSHEYGVPGEKKPPPCPRTPKPNTPAPPRSLNGDNTRDRAEPATLPIPLKPPSP